MRVKRKHALLLPTFVYVWMWIDSKMRSHRAHNFFGFHFLLLPFNSRRILYKQHNWDDDDDDEMKMTMIAVDNNVSGVTPLIEAHRTIYTQRASEKTYTIARTNEQNTAEIAMHYSNVFKCIIQR